MRPARIGLMASALSLLGWTGAARAEGPYVHARASAGHAITEPQADELGWGGGGAVVLDVPIGKHVGLELGGSALALAQGAPPADPSFAQRQAGTVFGGVGGVRLSLGGLWIDGGAGIAATGTGAQPMVQADLGYDIHVRGRFWIGPYVGYTQVADLGDSLRPGDARVLQVGFEISFGAKSDKKPPVFLAKAPPPRRPPPPPPPPPKPPSDRDHDGVLDAEDACPDVFGVRTTEPSTNGCPPTTLKLAGDRIELPDRIYFDFASPRVKERSRPLLRQIAEYIQARGDIEQVEVDGYADKIGTEEYNVYLSRLRAENVTFWLRHYGVASRLVTHAYGDKNPRVQGHTVDELRENRRVEFYVQRTAVAPPPASAEGPHASNP